MKTIGRYEVEGELGEGGMASVHLAVDPYIKRKVAVKVISLELANDSLAFNYFKREAQVIAALDHSCIVPIYDFGQHGDQLYIIMRYMPGGTLEDLLLKQEELHPRQLAEIFERIASALDAAHEQNVVHRDVKPSNILFDGRNDAFLSDFGLAKWPSRTTGQSSNMIMGTPEYMSPEQAKAQEVDGRSDVYALGVVLYEALAGQPPFQKEYAMATAVAHVNDPIPNILELNSNLKPAWGDIVTKALQKKPENRYQTAGELAQDVIDLAAGRWYWRKLDELGS